MTTQFLYHAVKDRGACKRIIDHLFKSRNEHIIIPYSDSPGPLIEEICSQQCKSLTIFEPNRDKRDFCSNLVNRNVTNRNINVLPCDIMKLHSTRLSIDNTDEAWRNFNTEFMSALREAGTNNLNGQQLNLFVPLMKSKQEQKFLAQVYNHLAQKTGLYALASVHYYLLISEKLSNYLSVDRTSERFNMKTYRAVSVLNNTLFQIKKLDSFELKTCFNINWSKIQSTSKRTSAYYRHADLVYLEPRQSVIDSMVGNSLIEYKFLVSQMMSNKSRKVKTFLELWFQGCGGELEQFNIKEETTSGDLEWRQFYELYLYLKERKNYSNSTFVDVVQNMESNPFNAKRSNFLYQASE